MAPVNPNFTRRLFVDYEVADVPHELQIRISSVASPIDTLDSLYYILNFCSAALPVTWTVTGVRTSAAGSDISVPIDYSASELFGFTGAVTDPFPAVNHPRQLNWVGRSGTSGRRWRMGLYGALFTTPANYRLGPGETVFASAEVFAALSLMAANGQLLAIDGTSPTIYNYVNVNFNSYWESERRSSS